MRETKIKKILLVDDDPTVAYITQRLLRKVAEETAVLLARNGREALDILLEVCRGEECPELILLDINMPVMNGFEFLEELHKSADLSTADIKVVLLSSSEHHLDLEKAKQYPAVAHVQKPLTVEILSKLL